MVEFKEKVFEFKYKGESYRLTYPTVQESIDFNKGLVKAEDKGLFVLNFFESLGLEKEKALKLQDDHIMEIVHYLTGRKKK